MFVSHEAMLLLYRFKSGGLQRLPTVSVTSRRKLTRRINSIPRQGNLPTLFSPRGKRECPVRRISRRDIEVPLPCLKRREIPVPVASGIRGIAV